MKREILYLLVLILAAGCSDHADEKKPVDPEDNIQLVFVPESVGMSTRSGDEEPSEAIHNLEILVFEDIEKNNTLAYTYRTTAEETNTKKKYNVTLRLSDVPVKLLLIANHTNFENVTFGYTIEEAAETLVSSFTSAGINKIPMYGEISFPDGITKTVEIEENIPLLRSVAAVQVSVIDQLFNDQTFRLKSMEVYRANNLIQVIPNASAFSTEEGTWKVASPSVPTAAQNMIMTGITPTGNEAVQALGQIFLPESKKKEGTAITSESTCLIVGGVYKGSGYEQNEETSYYRIDFRTEDRNVRPVLRNYLYNITITEVSGPGTTHPEDADSYDIKTTISDWDDSDHEIDL